MAFYALVLGIPIAKPGFSCFCTDGSHPGNSFNREVLPLENGEKACQLGEKPVMEILRKLLESKKSAVASADLSGASVTSVLSIINFSLFCKGSKGGSHYG